MTTTFSMIIDGEQVAAVSGESISTIDPSDGQEIARVPRAGREDIDRSVLAAQRASHSWRGLAAKERARRLGRLADLLLDHQEELAELETRDNGKPLSQSRNDVAVAARYFAYYAGLADKLEGIHIPLDDGAFAFTEHEPYGVVAIIVPWNAPINQAARSAAPALAAANTIIIKPAEDTPLTAIRLAALALEAGLPAGTLNVVTGYGHEAGRFLTEHGGVRMISFTGSVETGRAIGRVAADRIVPVTLELGGKSANIVFPDADAEKVAGSIAQTIVKNAGQVCSAATRVLVHRDVVDDVVQAAVRALSTVTIGAGMTDPDLGPLISRKQMERVLGYIAAGENEGAIRLTPALAPDGATDGKGFFVAPTLFRDVRNDMSIGQDEIFGPVVSVIAFDTEVEAVQLANASRYGLTAGVVTRDIDRAFRIARQLEAGQVFINKWHAGGVETPFGGYKDSGLGREKGADAIKHYTQTRTTVVSS
jgi:aldehyde dehydrogenase (NAD+)